MSQYCSSFKYNLSASQHHQKNKKCCSDRRSILKFWKKTYSCFNCIDMSFFQKTELWSSSTVSLKVSIFRRKNYVYWHGLNNKYFLEQVYFYIWILAVSRRNYWAQTVWNRLNSVCPYDTEAKVDSPRSSDKNGQSINTKNNNSQYIFTTTDGKLLISSAMNGLFVLNCRPSVICLQALSKLAVNKIVMRIVSLVRWRHGGEEIFELTIKIAKSKTKAYHFKIISYCIYWTR